MKLDKSNQWLALLANIGVVAGIIFLAFELQRSGTVRDHGSGKLK